MVGLLLASNVSGILMEQLCLVKGGAMRERVRYCPEEKEVLKSVDKLEGAQRRMLLYMKG